MINPVLTARELVAKFGGDWLGSYGLMPAPGHSKADRGVKAWSGPDGQIRLHSFHGDSWQGLRAAFGLDAGPREHKAPAKPKALPDPKAEAGRASKLALAQRIWDTARSLIDGDPVTTYLRGRRIGPPYRSALRYHPSAPIMEGGGQHPAMIALISHANGNCTGIHLTYLATGGAGKAAGLRSGKKMLGSVTGAACWPNMICERMAIAEGIESAIAVERLHRLPCIAALAAGNLHRVALPPQVRKLVIVADQEPSGKGLEAAHRAIAHYRRLGIRVEAIAPPMPPGAAKWDAADELVRVMA